MSLADEIAQMLDPRPAAEPGEDEDIDGAFALGNLHEESYEQPPEPKKGRKPRMRAAIDLGSSAAKYAGRVVSRERLAREQRHETKQQSASEDEDDEDDDDEEEDDNDEDKPRFLSIRQKLEPNDINLDPNEKQVPITERDESWVPKYQKR